MRAFTAVLAVLLLPVPLLAQEGKNPDPVPSHPDVDQKKVDEAIRTGIDYLRSQVPTLDPKNPADSLATQRRHELVLWTMIHAGVPETDRTLQQLLEFVLKQPLDRTYQVALQAMILEELQRVHFQPRIAQCAQFLADNQCGNGQWSYGHPVNLPEEFDMPTGSWKPDVPSSDGTPSAPGARKKPAPFRKITIKKRDTGPATGDNSNSQYAALGIRACADAGLLLDPRILRLARQFWEETQKRDGGWCYAGHEGHVDHRAYGSMTAGGVGSLCIYYHLQEKNWRKSRNVLDGIAWLTGQFTVRSNPGWIEHAGTTDQWMLYYWLYGLERAGVLFGTDRFGREDWYPVGTNRLLSLQTPEGTWGGGLDDTCFAILFLRRATRPLDDHVPFKSTSR